MDAKDRMKNQPPPVSITMVSMTDEEFQRRLMSALEIAVQSGIAHERKRTENREIDEGAAISFIIDNSPYSSRETVRNHILENLEYRFDATSGRTGTRKYKMIDVIELCESMQLKKRSRTTNSNNV